MHVAPPVSAGATKPRTVCKGCRRRRRLNKITGYCPLCTSLRSDNKHGTSNSVTGYWSAVDEEPLAITRVDTKAVQQIQMLSGFLEAHFPVAGKLESDLYRKLSYLTHLPSLDLSSPLLSNAVNSLCLAHFGARANDRRLLQASQDFYGNVLGSLLQTLRTQPDSKRRNHRDVLTGIMLISLYDDAMPNAQRGNTTWVTHFTGALRYIESVGPSALDMSQLFDTRLLQNLRMPALFLSIAHRKHLVFGQPEWRQPKSSHLQGSGPNDWYPMLSPFPGMLERADNMLVGSSSPHSGIGVARLCRELDEFRASLLAFVDKDFAGLLYSPVAGSGKGVTQVGVTDFPAFDMAIEEHCFITSSETFLTFHVFNGGGGQGLRCTMSWLSCLIADCTLLQLFKRYPALGPLLGHSSAEIERRALICAQHICRSVYAFSRLGSVAYGDYLSIFVQVANNFFEEYGAVKEMGWCQACLIATSIRIERMRRTSRPTLCRIGDLALDIAEATRYRTRNTMVVHETDSSSTAATALSTYSGSPLSMRTQLSKPG